MEHVVTSADNGSGSAGFVVRALLHQRKVKEGNQTREIESSTKEKLRCVCVKGAGEKKREMAGCTPDCDECTWPLVAPRDQNVLGKEEKKKKNFMVVNQKRIGICTCQGIVPRWLLFQGCQVEYQPRRGRRWRNTIPAWHACHAMPMSL